MSDLGTLGPKYKGSWGIAINSSDQVTGYSWTQQQSNHHAFLYSNGKMTDLGTMGAQNSYASGINSRGDVVGYVDGPNRAFLFSDGQMIDLNTVLDPDSGAGWALGGASAINDSGQILASGYFQGSTVLSTVILTPMGVPAQR